MFAKLENGNALCLADYGDIKRGAIVPPVNELWAQVQEWLDAGNDWEPHVPLLTELEGLRKEVQRQKLKQERIKRVNAPINNVQVATPEDRENVQWAANNVESIDWIMADNTVQTMTAEQLQAVIVEYAERKMQVFATYAALLQQLSESDDPESVVWPED